MQRLYFAHPVLVCYALTLDLYYYSTLFSPTPPAYMKNIAKVSGDNSKEFIKMALCQGTQNNMPLKT